MSVNINPDTTSVSITAASNTITVVDTANSVNVSTSQPTTSVVTVAIPGPQGAPGAIPSTGSFATTGSNSFNGNQTINGTITLDNNSVIKDTVNQSISFGVDAAESGQGTQSTAIGSNAGQTDQGNGATALGALAGNLQQGQSAVAIGALAGSTQQGAWAIAIGAQAGGISQGNYSIALGNLAGGLNQAANSITINATGAQLDNTTASSLKIAPIRINDDGSQNILVYNTTTKEVSYSVDKFATTGSVTFTGNQIVTGSSRGNVTALMISSNTASMDLSVGNFFTLQLVSGSNTHINPSSILPGQTSILTLYTTGSATVSFPNSVKQPSGSTYIPTTSSGVDILTLASIDSSTLYVVAVKNLI